jgi:endonuclease III
MATPNRPAIINRTLKVLRKHFKPSSPPKDRSLFEHLLFACLVEDSPPESAEQVFATLKNDYFGWNEVRVSTIRELTDALKPLVNPAESAGRLKQTLHSVFESVYEFDIETMKKQNIGAAAKTLHKYNGTTPFAVAYVTQHALGGHAIPLNRGAMITLHTVGMISDDEFAKNIVPGLERAVPKSKGSEVASLLHQLGVEVGKNPYGPAARKLMLEIDPNCKDRLPKRPVPKPPEAPKPEPPKAEQKPSKTKGKESTRDPAKEAARKQAEAKADAKKPKKPLPKQPAPTKKPAKQAKRPTKKGAKRPTSRKLTKKKPR